MRSMAEFLASWGIMLRLSSFSLLKGGEKLELTELVDIVSAKKLQTSLRLDIGPLGVLIEALDLRVGLPVRVLIFCQTRRQKRIIPFI